MPPTPASHRKTSQQISCPSKPSGPLPKARDVDRGNWHCWLLLQPFDIVPIPGTKRAVYVEENLAATNVALSPDEIAYISSVFAPERIVGQRYAPIHAVHVANKK